MKHPKLSFTRPLDPNRWDLSEPAELKRQADFWESVLKRPDGTWPELEEALRLTEGITYPPQKPVR